MKLVETFEFTLQLNQMYSCLEHNQSMCKKPVLTLALYRHIALCI